MKNKNLTSLKRRRITSINHARYLKLAFMYALLTAMIVCPLFIADALNAGEDVTEAVDQEQVVEMLKYDIVNKLKEIKEKSRETIKIYNESTEKAKNLKSTAEQKLEKLKEAIKNARGNEKINKPELEKAAGLRDKAEMLFSKKEYSETTKTVDRALEHITKVPIVSLTISPQIVSPDGDGVNDEITISIDVSSENEIKKWALNMYKLNGGKEEEAIIKRWEGDEMPPGEIEWDCRDEGKLMIDSAEDYAVELTAVDVKGGKGVSNKLHLKSDVFAVQTDRGPRINVSSINFDYNKARLKPQYKDIVEKVHEYLLEFPDYKIVVEGHTDPVGSADFNVDLGKRRAESVADYLIDLGIDESRIETYGLGESMPVTHDLWKAALNRRVSFILLKDKEDMKEYTEFYNNELDLNKEAKMKNKEILWDLKY